MAWRAVTSPSRTRRWILTAFIVVAASVGVAIAESGWPPQEGLRRVQAENNADAVPLAEYESTRSYYPAERWHQAARPELLGWSSEKLAEALDYAEELGTSALVIVENGVIVDAWGDLRKRYQSRSMRKSYLSILFGQAVANQRVRLFDSLGELGIDDDPPLTAKELDATVFDLLTARSGVYHPANFESKSMRRKRPARGSHAPGSFWYYNNWDFNALGTIYERATGRGVFEAFQQEIATPLALQHYRLKDTEYFRGKYSVHPAYRFRMSPLDLARVGLLYLREGVWQGQQVIPAAWVDQSTEAHVDTGRKGFYAGYGFMWWVGKDGFAAVGAKGQRLFVMPARDLVIVHLVDADLKDRSVSSKKIRSLLKKVLAAKTGARLGGLGLPGSSRRLALAAPHRMARERLSVMAGAS